uniref:CRAL-TRIO domain-containing protein n=1 Tax=Angiostrongylus cantonensis TaxID=6313 RepID=A0A0K0CSV7_ANGCA
MSCKIVPPQKYNVVKYVDVHAKTPLTIYWLVQLYNYLSSGLFTTFFSRYRDTAVVFVVNQPPLFKSFRIRLSSITDRILLSSKQYPVAAIGKQYIGLTKPHAKQQFLQSTLAFRMSFI